ncbi:MAG: ATP phosphoribosyltransferase [Candidatus Coatesbacteria bacterium]|nr:ATP phosphoribosyltransferase [Candidatus Coatesbacteria bacterium]
MKQSNRLRIAMQKSGKLSEGSIDLMKKCGLSVLESKTQLLSRVQELPIDILLVRDNDIPSFVSEGVCDAGIVGENVYKEFILSSNYSKYSRIIEFLGFSRCRLSIAIPENIQYSTLSDLNGLKIATYYTGILKDFLESNNINAEIVKMQGSIEVAPHMNISDAICDIVCTGVSLESNGLKEILTLMKSQAILIGNTEINEDKQQILDKLLKRMKGVLSARESKYIMLNAYRKDLKAITRLLPGAESPTILQLEDQDKVAIHAVCLEPVFWETMEKLKQAGASSILVVPIEKMMS